MWTQNRVQAAPVVVSKRHLAAAEPQAVVINSGVANAATGAQGERDAVATAGHAAGLLGLAPEQIVVLSTGVIGAPLPMDRIVAGLDAAAPALSADGGDDAAEAILTTDTNAKTPSPAGDGFTVGGMAKGSGMIRTWRRCSPSSRPTTRSPGRGDRVPAARRRGELQRDLGRRRVLDERRGRAALVRRGADRAHARHRRGVRARAAHRLQRPVAPDRRRRRGRDARRRDQRLRRPQPGGGEGDRAAHRHVAAREDRALRPRRQLGPRADGGRQRAVQRRLRASRPRARLAALQRHPAVLVAGAPQNVEPSVDGAVCTIDLDLGLGDGAPAT